MIKAYDGEKPPIEESVDLFVNNVKKFWIYKK